MNHGSELRVRWTENALLVGCSQSGAGAPDPDDVLLQFAIRWRDARHPPGLGSTPAFVVSRNDNGK